MDLTKHSSPIKNPQTVQLVPHTELDQQAVRVTPVDQWDGIAYRREGQRSSQRTAKKSGIQIPPHSFAYHHGFLIGLRASKSPEMISTGPLKLLVGENVWPQGRSGEFQAPRWTLGFNLQVLELQDSLQWWKEAILSIDTRRVPRSTGKKILRNPLIFFHVQVMMENSSYGVLPYFS
ncbi:hypothetical protein E3N88_02413 [Mikania micrantha]|uniref:Uncharacterized protein n=1 Tax=Mikania micrantha TaxID=192012 RepID=A0A5N6Q670_9ASTR|nr:hypothetical protein E3N88_02413 [Mikania micrantha]